MGPFTYIVKCVCARTCRHKHTHTFPLLPITNSFVFVSHSKPNIFQDSAFHIQEASTITPAFSTSTPFFVFLLPLLLVKPPSFLPWLSQYSSNYSFCVPSCLLFFTQITVCPYSKTCYLCAWNHSRAQEKPNSGERAFMISPVQLSPRFHSQCSFQSTSATYNVNILFFSCLLHLAVLFYHPQSPVLPLPALLYHTNSISHFKAQPQVTPKWTFPKASSLE